MSQQRHQQQFHWVHPERRHHDFVPDEAQAHVLRHRRGPLVVSGGPGTGKTESLIHSAVAAVEAGVAPERVLLLGLNRQDTGYLRRRVNAATAPFSAAEVAVFTPPALSHAVVKSRAQHHGRAVPRLLTGPESDALLRELLRNEDFAWPEEFGDAIGTYAFSAQLRDLILRCEERGISGRRLAALGREHDRPLWTSAARVLERYRDTLAIQSASVLEVYDSAELTRVALHLLRTGEVSVGSFDVVLVDDFQDFTPAGVELAQWASREASRVIVAGNPDEAIFGFQGGVSDNLARAEQYFRHAGAAEEVRLECAHGSALQVTEVVDRFARSHMSGSHRLRNRSAGHDVKGSVEAFVASSPNVEARHIAGRLRRAHLLDGVAWSEMAVVVKSASELAALRRTLQHSGVPTAQASDDMPLGSYGVVRDLLQLSSAGVRWRAADDSVWLSEDQAPALLLSLYGGADPYDIRRLKQHIRRVHGTSEEFRNNRDVLATFMSDPLSVVSEAVEERWYEPALRVARLLLAAAESRGVASTLWRVWEDSGVAERLERRAVSPDRRARRADAELDAVIALLDLAADFEQKQPGVGVEVFAEHVLAQQLPGDSLSARAELSEAVTLTTVHGAHGRSWDLVVVARVQEDEWPNLRPRGSVLGAEALVELLEGRADVDVVAELLAEERRLFLTAMSRARSTLVLSAVDSEDEQSSRFIDEVGVTPQRVRGTRRELSLTGLVASLRSVVMSEGPPARLATAASLLRRLASEGVTGADPGSWWGTADLSSSEALYRAGDRLNISPSKVEKVQQCGLRWVLESHGADSGAAIHRFMGSLFHLAAEEAVAVPAGDRLEAMRSVIDRHFDELPHEAEWKRRQDRESVDRALEKFAEWWAKDPRELVGVERDFRVEVPFDAAEVEVRLSGRVDRLERDGSGHLVVVDIKTGTTAASKVQTDGNAQLAAYQFAISEGAFPKEGEVPGGAVLVYPRHKAKQATERVQGPLSEAANPDWARDLVVDSAEQMSGSSFEVHRDDQNQCQTCSVKTCCPLWDEGKRVTDLCDRVSVLMTSLGIWIVRRRLTRPRSSVGLSRPMCVRCWWWRGPAPARRPPCRIAWCGWWPTVWSPRNGFWV
ncbi:ATP-dependent DNA helicase [Haloglycomyces albus]|uniref:ATP-dependent DNA helicase n=1 Tax=Haloglycomyces albus TaxID=526067 RepID=UPI0006854D63|nr:ATP-dependent DNA helicase [Haloglycomyces albus]